MISRAQARCAATAVPLRHAQAWLHEVAALLDELPAGVAGPRLPGVLVRQRVEACLDALAALVPSDPRLSLLRPALEHLITVMRRLGDGLYACYDVSGLPRTNNDHEHFYRQLKAHQRRITGRKRADSFVVRVGEFAVYAAAAHDQPEALLRQQLAQVPADRWQAARRTLHANQERQAQMHRFKLHRDRYLADLEARWNHRPPL